MISLHRTIIELHLVTGQKQIFYQEDAEVVERICSELDGHIFMRDSLIIDSEFDLISFPGRGLIGITILVDPLPESFLEKEMRSKTEITQVSHEAFQIRRLEYMSRIEGERGLAISQLEFVSGERLFLEISQIGETSMDERMSMHHLFSRPSLSCRRPEGGFSIWNTAQVVSWSHYPKLDVPANSWPAESLSGRSIGRSQPIALL